MAGHAARDAGGHGAHVVSSAQPEFLIRAVTHPKDLADPEYGVVQVRIDHRDEPDGRFFLADVCAADWQARWLPGFAERFIDSPQEWERFDARTYVRNATHEKSPIPLPGGGEALVDRNLRKYIRALNDRGHVTTASCQGSAAGNRPAYIQLAPFEFFPPELTETWRDMGFAISPTGDRVTARAPVGLVFKAGSVLHLTLSDWFDGNLASPDHYRAKGLRPPSLPLLGEPFEPPAPHQSLDRAAVGRDGP